MRTVMAWKKTISVLAGALAIGCGGGNGSPDGGGGGADASEQDGGPTGPELPVLRSGTLEDPTASPAVMTCLGSRTQPTPGGDVDVTMNLLFFSGGTPARGVDVWFFRDNVIRDTCEAGVCQMGTSSTEDGTLTFTGSASGWYAYRVFEHDGPTSGTSVVDSVQYNEPAPATAGAVDGNAVELSTVNLIPALLGGPRTPGTALIAGRVMDCEETSLRGATIRMYDGDTLIAEGEPVQAPHYRYFNGDSTPDAEGTHTHVDGLYAAVNIPIPTGADGLLRVEAWGRPSDESPAGGERIGCEAMRAFADAVTIINVGPERSDYPTDHPCAE